MRESTTRAKEQGRFPDWPLSLPNMKFILFAVVVIFAAVAGRTFITSFFAPPTAWLRFALEGVVVVFLLSPLYFLYHLPLRSYYADHLKEHGEIRSLSQETLRIMEGERRALAKELHDNFGQTLTALQFRVDILRFSLPPERADLQEQCDQMQACIGTLGDEMRGMCAHLHPSMLETRGIVPAIEWHLQRLRDYDCGVELTFEGADCGEDRLSPEAKITLYRICEEGLNNVLRHAGASRAVVRLECAGDAVVLTIVDDGRGFDSAQPVGIGIPGMRERAAALGGTFEIVSAQGQGTVVRAQIPV